MSQKNALQIASTLVSTIIAVWTADKPMLYPTLDKAREVLFSRFDKILEQRKIKNWANDFETILAEKIEPILIEFNIEEDEIIPVQTSLVELFAHISTTPELWVKTGFSEDKLEKELTVMREEAVQGYSEKEKALYYKISEEGFRIIGVAVQALPDFAKTGTATLLTVFSNINTVIDERIDEKLRMFALSQKNSDEKDQTFEEHYREVLANKIDKPDEFGLTETEIDSKSKEYRISTAFVSLLVNYEGNFKSEDIKQIKKLGQVGAYEEREQIEDRIRQKSGKLHEVLPKLEIKRLLIRGEAGSGKTTILSWLAANLARGKFPKEYSELQKSFGDYLPFFIRLRDFANKKLPSPLDFHYFIESDIGYEIPDGFADRKLKAGQAILLIDGVDELAPERREDVLKWISQKLEVYTEAPIIVTSRSEATEEGWLKAKDFSDSVILSMKIEEIRAFIKNWHKAMGSNVDAKGKLLIAKDKKLLAKIKKHETDLLKKINNNAELKRLAETPLLCSALCALNYYNAALPNNRLELYKKFVKMLVKKREDKRGIEAKLTSEQRLEIVALLAKWMLSHDENKEALFVVDKKAFEVQSLKFWDGIKRDEEYTDKEVLDDIFIRSGVLRHTSGESVEFIHRTLAEYLAAEKFVLDNEKGLLKTNINNDIWHEVIRFAVGHATMMNANYAKDIAGTIIDKVKAVKNNKKLALLYISLLEFGLFRLDEVNVKVAMENIPSINNEQEFNTILLAKSWAAPYLKYNSNWTHEQAGFALQALIFIDTNEAWEVIKSYRNYEPSNRNDKPEPVINQLMGYKYNGSVDRLEIVNSIITAFKENLIILRLDNLPRLNNLEVLTKLEKLTSLRLHNLPQLNNLEGMPKLENLTELSLNNLPQLNNLAELTKLENLKNLRLINLLQLNNLEGMPKLENLTELRLINLPQLNNLKGMPKLDKLTNLWLSNLPQLDNLEGMPKLDNLTGVWVDNLPQLGNLRIIAEKRSFIYLT